MDQRRIACACACASGSPDAQGRGCTHVVHRVVHGAVVPEAFTQTCAKAVSPRTLRFFKKNLQVLQSQSQGGPLIHLRHATEGAGPRAGRDAPPETRLDPPRGSRAVRGGQRGSPPRGVRAAASATATEGAGPRAGRDAHPETRLGACEFAAKSKTVRRFVTLGPPRDSRVVPAAGAGAGARPGGSGETPPPPPPRERAGRAEVTHYHSNG